MEVSLLDLLSFRGSPDTKYVLELDEHCSVSSESFVVGLLTEAANVPMQRVQHEIL